MKLEQEIIDKLYDLDDAYIQIAPKDGEDFIIFDDWKSVINVEKALKPDFEPKDEFDDSVLIDMGIDYGFSDSFAICSECGEVIETEPDSYSWKPDFFVNDYGITCGDCVRDNPGEYIAWLLENPEERANTILSEDELEDAGFTKVEGDYESGWYDRHDSPSEILAKVYEEHPDALFIFNIRSNGQFATQFDLWMSEE